MIISTHIASQKKFRVVLLSGYLPFIDDCFEFKLTLSCIEPTSQSDFCSIIKVQDVILLDLESSISGVITQILTSDNTTGTKNSSKKLSPTLEVCFSHPLAILKYSNLKTITHQTSFKRLIEQIMQPILPLIKIKFLSKYDDDHFIIPKWMIQGSRYEAFQVLLNHVGAHYIVDNQSVPTIYITCENHLVAIPFMQSQKLIQLSEIDLENSTGEHVFQTRSAGTKTIQFHQKRIFKSCAISVEDQVLYILQQDLMYRHPNTWTVKLQLSTSPFSEKRAFYRGRDVQGLSIGQVSSQVRAHKGDYRITLNDQGYEENLTHVEDLKLTHSPSAVHKLSYQPQDKLVLLKHQNTHYILGAETNPESGQSMHRKKGKTNTKTAQIHSADESKLYALKLSKAAGMVITQSQILKIRFRKSAIYLKENMEVNSQGSAYLKAKAELLFKAKKQVLASDNIQITAQDKITLDVGKAQLNSLSLLWQSDDIVMALPFIHVGAQDIFLSTDQTSFISESLELISQKGINLNSVNILSLNSEFTLHLQVGLAGILFQNKQMIFSGTNVRMQAGVININSPKGV